MHKHQTLALFAGKQPCWEQCRKINVKFHPNFCLQKRDSLEKVCLDSKRISYWFHWYQNVTKQSYWFQVFMVLDLWMMRLKTRLSWTILWQRVTWTRDKMCASYFVSRVTRTWPLAVFYILMKMAGINSWVLYTINTPSDEPQSRIFFLKNLSLSLMKASPLKISNTFTAWRCVRIS